MERSQVFVNIHVNFSTNKVASGFLVLFNKKGISLANSISNFVDEFPNNLGTKDKSNSLFVLRKFKGPAVLIEGGFISNDRDRAIMLNRSSKIGQQIAEGIIKFLK